MKIRILESMVSMMDQESTSMKASAPTTANYGVNVKVFGKTKIELPFTQLMVFCELKSLSMRNQLP